MKLSEFDIDFNKFKNEKDTFRFKLTDAFFELKENSLYQHGDFVDLCKGPHLNSTGEVKVFKLLKVAGAYWRGDEKNTMLQRIYGSAFANQKELAEYLERLEEAERRDHRKLAKELELLSISEKGGAGLVYWHPKGSITRKIIEDFWREEHIKRGYELVYTPHIAKRELFETSGHYEYYKDFIFLVKMWVALPRNSSAASPSVSESVGWG